MGQQVPKTEHILQALPAPQTEGIVGHPSTRQTPGGGVTARLLLNEKASTVQTEASTTTNPFNGAAISHCLTFGYALPGVVVKFVSGDAAAVPRLAVRALRALVVTAAVVHRAVGGCLSCTIPDEHMVGNIIYKNQ